MMKQWSPFSVFTLATGVVLCLGAGACGKKAVSPPLAEGFRLDDPERAALPVLIVEGVSFTNADFARFAQLTLGEPGEGLTAEAAGRLFDDFVERKLIVGAAAARGFTLTETDKAASQEIFRATRDAAGLEKPATTAPEDFLEGILVASDITMQQVLFIHMSFMVFVVYRVFHFSAVL